MAEALGIELPKLPALNEEDLKAVRSFLPGKLLSCTAALFALAVLVLDLAGLVDQGVRRLLDADLSSTPSHYGLLFGLPLLAVASQLVIELRAERSRRTLQRLAVQTGVEQSGYFRIGPYLTTAEDRTKFDRADRAHERVLSWIEHSAGMPLYLTGDSGSGKSSLLNAFVLPTLRDRGWIVIQARAWQDPETALRNALSQLPSARRSRQAESQELRHLLTTATRAAGIRLLLVLDQFEEFLILGQHETQQKFASLITSLRTTPIQALSLLLVLRSDYQTLLDDIGLPPPWHGDNFYQIGRFAMAAATNFMTRSGLNLQADMLDHLLNSATELDETPGLVRPITLNVIGYVLATGKTLAMSADAGQLVRRYIELTVGQPAIRDFAPRVLERLVTEQGTKQPRSEQELTASTGLRRAEVRAVLNVLSQAALARPLDAVNGVWELSHDFIARAVTRFLGRARHELLQRSAFYASPVLLLVMLLGAVGVVAWEHFSPYEIRSKLAELGLTVTPTDNGLAAESNSHLTPKTFLSISPLLAKLPPLQSLDLSRTQVADLAPLKGLAALQRLNLSWTQVADLAPLKGLTTLQSLDLSLTHVTDLAPLKGLTTLQSLDLRRTQVADLAPLKGLAALQSLDLSWTQVADLAPLKGLAKLQRLNLIGTHFTDLEPLKGLTKLQIDR